MKRILVTTALPYANGQIHLGHMVEHIQADIWVRWHKLQCCSSDATHDSVDENCNGDGNNDNATNTECIFVCGDDAHGTPIMLSAQQQGITPEELVAAIKAQHEQDFAAFNISFDNYYTTHSPENQELATTIYRALQANDDIEVRTVTQAYDSVANIFLPDRFVRGTCPKCGATNQYGDNCEICGAAYSPLDLKDPVSVISGSVPTQKDSEHYFFRLEKYTNMLQQWTQNSGNLQPAIANKLQEWFIQGLKQWDISRDAPYFGFPIPDAPNKYFYVWLDAPVGYMASFKNLCERRPELDFATYWDKESNAKLYHFIGKDIVYFHSLFWPAMLEGSGWRKPTAIFVHGYLTVGGEKMSKSRGTFILARDYINSGLNHEYLRYYFAAKLNSGIDDIDLNWSDFVQRVNSDLVGKFVNIASRCAGFISKYFANQLATKLDAAELYQHFVANSGAIAKAYTALEYNTAMRLIMAMADKANQYIDEKKPWQMVKVKMDGAQDLQGVQRVCTMGLNLFRLLALYLKPVVPRLVQDAEQFLNIPPLTWRDRAQPLLQHTINNFQPLLQRVDEEKLKQLELVKK